MARGIRALMKFGARLNALREGGRRRRSSELISLSAEAASAIEHCSLPPSPVKLRFPGKTSMSARPVSSNPAALAAVGSARPATAMKLLSMLVPHFCYNPALMSQSFSLCMFCMLVRRTCARPGFPCRLRPGLLVPNIRKNMINQNDK